MEFEAWKEAMKPEAEKENEELREKIRKLELEVENLKREQKYTEQNESGLARDCKMLCERCYAQTHGAICMFCRLESYRCKHKQALIKEIANEMRKERHEMSRQMKKEVSRK